MKNEKYVGYEFVVYDWSVPVFKSLLGIFKEEERIISWNEDVKGLWLVELKIRKDLNLERSAMINKTLDCMLGGFEGKRVQ